MKNQNPEQIARDRIDELLRQAGWLIQSKDEINLFAAKGVAIREYQTDVGPADYVLFVNQKAVGIIEAKREEEGYRLTVVEEQSQGYANAKLKYLNNNALPFVYESTGILTRFTDYRDPKPRARQVFSFFRPETLEAWLKQEDSLRSRLKNIVPLNKEGLRPAQIVAIENLEQSFKNNRPRALIQMATGAGKTFTAATFIYRLLKHADAKRILFLVDTRNLGEQAEQEFLKYQPKDDSRKFTELYNVQLLKSAHIATDSQVCIATIQRLYAILKGEELDDNAELENPNESTWLQEHTRKKEPLPVVYNPAVPIEQFDFIVIDECHRSIYNLWRQVLDYFDAFLIGLTATPDKRTFGFFKENVVSEYTYEQSVIDGVNVPYEIYQIETEISKNGAIVEAGWMVERREKLTRKKRWQQEDEDTAYRRNDLDKKVVNISQIRNIIRKYKEALKTEIFPERVTADGDYEVPKTLVFAKTDSHADDIIRIIREEFNEGNDFCKKVTYRATEDPKSILNQFRNSYYPRIAVTVDMIATGTDVKPLEVLLFMRDVKSANYFEQMKGRGTRTVNQDDLQQVSTTAKVKTHYILVDAVGATRSKKGTSRPLERKRTVALKDLLGAVTMGVADEDLCLSLASRLLRLQKQISDKENAEVERLAGGKSLQTIASELLQAHDPDAIADKAIELMDQQQLPSLAEAEEMAQQQLKKQAVMTFNGPLNQYLEQVRKIHEQLIDTINIDTVLQAGWQKETATHAADTIQDFETYIAAHKDEIQALGIFYSQDFRNRKLTYQMLAEVLERLKRDKPKLAPHYVWEAYAQIEQVKDSSPKKELIALVSLLRRVCGLDQQLTAYPKAVDKNFQTWVFGKQAGALKFTDQQMDWLRMLKDHIATSFSVEVADLDYTPFDAQGGRGMFWKLFGADSTLIINELNEVLVA